MTALAARMGDWAGAARFDLGGGKVELSFRGGEKVALDATADEMDGFLSRWVAAVAGAKGCGLSGEGSARKSVLEKKRHTELRTCRWSAADLRAST